MITFQERLKNCRVNKHQDRQTDRQTDKYTHKQTILKMSYSLCYHSADEVSLFLKLKLKTLITWAGSLYVDVSLSTIQFYFI